MDSISEDYYELLNDELIESKKIVSYLKIRDGSIT